MLWSAAPSKIFPQGARVGTGSLRRAAQLRARRPDLQIEDIRGNVDTRLRKLDEGRYDAIVLAAAGLRRLGLENRITEVFNPGVMCPAVGQGALAVETRDDGGPAFQIAQAPGASRDPRRYNRRTCGAGGARRRMPGAHGSLRVRRRRNALRHRRSSFLRMASTVIRHAKHGPLPTPRRSATRWPNNCSAEGGKEILDAVYGRRTYRAATVRERNKVYLVGAGPGDPGLITWKGRKLLAIADSILYDNLANEHLLDLAPKNCERIYVGKKKSVHAFPQEEICAMMIDRARRGLNVVRLKGGDPFIFGRGGEELEALADAGVAFEVVPGVTSPLGIAAYSGIPLTHRAHNKVVTFVTGHDVHGIDWSKIGQSETLVIFMGIFSIREIAAEIHAPWTLGRHAGGGGSMGNAARSGNRGRHACDHRGSHRTSRPEAARHRDHRRSGCAARKARLVREAAAVRTQDRRDSRRRIRPPNCPIGCARSAPTRSNCR